jgi:hypothetical protein
VTTASIIVRTDLLLAVSRWTATIGHINYLDRVVFKRGEMVACDGHRIVRVPVDCHDLEFTLHRDHIAAISAAQSCCKISALTHPDHGGRAIRITMDGRHAVVDLGADIVMRFTTGDSALFPPYDQVMPKERAEGAPDGYGFDPKYLAAIHEVQVAAGAGPGMVGVRVTGWSSDGLGAMLFLGYMGIRYVIMPVRT